MYKFALILLFAVLAVATAQYISPYYGTYARTGYLGGLYRGNYLGYGSPLAYSGYTPYAGYGYRYY